MGARSNRLQNRAFTARLQPSRGAIAILVCQDGMRTDARAAFNLARTRAPATRPVRGRARREWPCRGRAWEGAQGVDPRPSPTSNQQPHQLRLIGSGEPTPSREVKRQGPYGGRRRRALRSSTWDLRASARVRDRRIGASATRAQGIARGAGQVVAPEGVTLATDNFQHLLRFQAPNGRLVQT